MDMNKTSGEDVSVGRDSSGHLLVFFEGGNGSRISVGIDGFEKMVQSGEVGDATVNEIYALFPGC